MLGMFDKKFDHFPIFIQDQGIFLKNGKLYFSFTAKNFDPIHRFYPKIPDRNSRNPSFVQPAGRNSIFSSIQALLVEADAGCLFDLSQKVSKQIKTMTGQIIKIATRCDHRVGTPVVFTG